ncbi:MAG: hypothetical protein GY847_07005 [Proteobacteria bacterium]|nr:hypothetical protein [Pseudomonadota bacterium]
MALAGAMLLTVFLSSCFHIVVQEIAVKTKFSKKYNCPKNKITFVEDDLNSRGDAYKLVGCGVTAVYKGSEEIYSQK